MSLGSAAVPWKVMNDPDVCGLPNAVSHGLRCSRHTAHLGECMYSIKAILDACVQASLTGSQGENVSKPNFEELAQEWLLRSTGHVGIGQDKSLARQLEKVWNQGLEAGYADGSNSVRQDIDRAFDEETDDASAISHD